MFRPGHVEISRLPTEARPGYHLTLDYHVEGAEPRPEWACFHLRVEAPQVHIDEQFRMHRDVAYNFLQRIRRCLRDHGVQVRQESCSAFTRCMTRCMRICGSSCTCSPARRSISTASCAKAEWRQLRSAITPMRKKISSSTGARL